MSAGRQQSRPIAAAQSPHGAVVPDEAVHVAVATRHARRLPDCVAPQDVDGVVQTLQTVLNATLLQRQTHGSDDRHSVQT